MKEIVYLAGGGNEQQSAKFDSLFLEDLQSRSISTLAYIPLALEPKKFPDAEKWFNGLFSDKGLNIEIWTDLKDKPLNPKETALYIGGGDTVRLLNKIREKGFDNILAEFLQNGGVIYGGSAGAIVLGADIRTAPEARDIQRQSYRGLDLLNGLSVACHFTRTNEEMETYKRLRKEIDNPIIAISERGGVIIEQNEVKIVGENEVVFF